MPPAITDAHDLKRFVAAQQPVYAQAVAELRAGEKRSHWIWFVLPQLRGLGKSVTASRYGISGVDEARAYLAHPLLGPRLHECISTIAAHAGRPVVDILGALDARKFQSCLTLFARAAVDPSPFLEALSEHFNGTEDAATVALLTGPRR